MECNKDEAIRAKKIAENKMMNNDFEGARKIALKARQLFPELENISQLLAVCDVHCSAQRKVYGGEKDLYGILQVESIADEATIKKQYRKLALVLHPDKNKFPGAEAAFKLIGEANMILSDRGKRSLHDVKCREPARPTIPKPRNHQRNPNPYDGMQFGAQFSGVNHHQQSQSNSNGRPSFWTHCPFCKIKYEYYRDMINRPIRCQNCTKLFIAYDMGDQRSSPSPHSQHAGMKNANLGSNSSRSTFLQQKEVRKQGNVNVDAQSSGRFSSHFAHQTCSSTEAQWTGGTKMEVNGKNMKTEGGQELKPDARISKDANKKKGRKAGESGEGSSDDEAFVGIGGNPSVGSQRRSSRKRSQVSYSEQVGDDSIPTKRSKVKKSSREVEDTQKEEVKVCNTSEEKHESKAEGVIPNENGHTESNSDPEDESEPALIDCPDLEFSNFDKDKEDHCFAVDQIWACYDTIDSMPRFYAQIKKVFSNGFRVKITWLEAEPDNHLEIIWAEEGLPVACGKFIRGNTEETRDRLMFSHLMVCEKGKSRFSYVIYPQKGEIWALFRDWDINWSSDPKSHTKFKFDIVEVLSDFDENHGVRVAYMVKVEGFVSLFQKTSRAPLAEHRIPTGELFRFSHRIPAVRLTGTERADVPAGSYELDTASLPEDLNLYYFSSKSNPNPESIATQTDPSYPKSPEAKAKPASRPANTPKKPINPEGKNETDKVMLNLRRSPRVLKGNFDESNGVDNPFLQDGFTKSTGLSSPSGGKESKVIIHNFIADKWNRTFQENEIWAIRRNKDGNPSRCYAQIKKIESSPLRLHIDLLESCTSSNNSTGLFKPSVGTRQICPQDSFLYLVNAKLNGKNRFNIYPKEKEIWALYNKQDSDSDLDSGECDFVEVLESNGDVNRVLPLSHVAGYKSVFRVREIENSKTSVVEIPHGELDRFAYQVPAFLLTEEQDGRLRGCWELDLDDVPGPPPSQE